MDFQKMLDQLRDIIREHVKNGRFTERNLAYLTGTSQPHLHNVLKGIRVLTPELADQLLACSSLTIADLIDRRNPRKIPTDAPTQVVPDALSVVFPFQYIKEPAFLSLEPDHRMAPRFQAGDVVLFDESPAARTELDSRAAYLVNYEGKSLVRYIRHGGKRIYLVTEDSLHDPLRWAFVSIQNGNTLEVIRGRIVSICRKLET